MSDVTQSNRYTKTIAGSSLFFFYLNDNLLLSRLVPEAIRTIPLQAWKWRNTVNSLVHAVISGCGAFLYLYLNPELRKDLTRRTSSSHVLLSLSIGYFIYDSIDMMLNNFGGKTFELMIHHTLVLASFITSVTTRRLQGLATGSLVLEGNSIFLHLRRLIILQGWDRESLEYRTIIFLNYSTLVFLRIIPTAWMIRWVYTYKEEISFKEFCLLSVSLLAIAIMNLHLSYRLIKSDFQR